MNETRWWKYLQRLMGDQSQLEAAQFIGISKSNITRWKDGTRAAPDFVVKVARAYNANVLEALVEAEFITEEEANLREVRVGGLLLSEATDEQLTGELLRRLNLIDDSPVDDLAARRSNRNISRVDFTAYGVADDSPDEGGNPDDYVP